MADLRISGVGNMKFLYLGILMSLAHAYAGVDVDWVCPKGSSEKFPLKVGFESNGKLSIKPDIFAGSMKSGSVNELSQCIQDFQKNVSSSVASFKKNNCPSSQDPLCYASLDYTNGKILEKLKASHLVKSTTGITVSALGKEEQSSSSDTAQMTPDLILQNKISKGEVDLTKAGETFEANGKSYKVSDFDEVMSEHLGEALSKISVNDAKQFAQNYLIAKNDLIKGPASQKKTVVLNNLNTIFQYAYGDQGAAKLSEMLECKPEDKLKPISDILDNIEKSKKVSDCADLNPGDHKVFEHKEFYSTGDYLLRRKPDGTYQVALNVKFKQSEGATVTAEQMLTRAKGCLQNASYGMKGPNGEKMEFMVLTPEETAQLPASQRPRTRNVSVEGPTYGTNAASYNQDVGCSTITHEMLHLLGLCDEYLETRTQYASNNWTCRIVTKAPSIMRDLSVYDQALPKTVSCDCSGKLCASVMKSPNENLKKMYVGRSGYEMLHYEFRRKYCSPSMKTIWGEQNLQEPDKSAILKSDLGEKFTFEIRGFSENPYAPFYKVYRNEVSCNCPAGDQECLKGKAAIAKAMKASKVNDLCPNGSKLQKREYGSQGVGAKFDDNVLTLQSEPSLPSLLQPSHFYKILHGNCKNSKVDSYNECAEFAYKSPPCNAPEKCRDDSYYLGSDQ